MASQLWSIKTYSIPCNSAILSRFLKEIIPSLSLMNGLSYNKVIKKDHILLYFNLSKRADKFIVRISI